MVTHPYQQNFTRKLWLFLSQRSRGEIHKPPEAACKNCTPFITLRIHMLAPTKHLQTRAEHLDSPFSFPAILTVHLFLSILSGKKKVWGFMEKLHPFLSGAFVAVHNIPKETCQIATQFH